MSHIIDQCHIELGDIVIDQCHPSATRAFAYEKKRYYKKAHMCWRIQHWTKYCFNVFI